MKRGKLQASLSREALTELAKSLVREIAQRFLEQGVGTPDQQKRIDLGKDRHALNHLLQSDYIRNVSNKYYPTFRALFFVPPDSRSRCEIAIEGVFHVLKYLYKKRSFERYTLHDIQNASDLISRPMTYEAVRKGAQFLRDFPIYCAHLDSTSDEPVSAVLVVENILDFENLAQAWEDEMTRRHPVQTSVMDNEKQLPVGALQAQELKSPEAAKRIFVIHGRDERLRVGMFTFLRALRLEPLEWTQAIQLTRKGSPYIGEILDAAFRHAQAVVVLLTPDDEARLRDDLVNPTDPDEERMLMVQARPNVLFEAGMALASHPDRTVLVQVGSVRPFSDVAGRHIVRMDNSVTKRNELAVKLKTAGCPVDLDGTDWQTVGDLTPPAQRHATASSPSMEGNRSNTGAAEPQSKTIIAGRIIVAPVSRSTSHAEFSLEKLDELGALIRLPSGVNVRIPKPDYIESWDDALNKPKLVLTRKYFQGYFPGHEHAEEYFLPR